MCFCRSVARGLCAVVYGNTHSRPDLRRPGYRSNCGGDIRTDNRRDNGPNGCSDHGRNASPYDGCHNRRDPDGNGDSRIRRSPGDGGQDHRHHHTSLQ